MVFAPDGAGAEPRVLVDAKGLNVRRDMVDQEKINGHLKCLDSGHKQDKLGVHSKVFDPISTNRFRFRVAKPTHPISFYGFQR